MKNLPEKYKHLRELSVYDNIRDLLITNLRNNPDKIYIEQAPQRIMNLFKDIIRSYSKQPFLNLEHLNTFSNDFDNIMNLIWV